MDLTDVFIAKKLAGGGGGGNYAEMVGGYVTPFLNYSPEQMFQFAKDLTNGNVSAVTEIDGTGMGGQVLVSALWAYAVSATQYFIHFEVFQYSNDNGAAGFELVIQSEPNRIQYTRIGMYSGGQYTDLSAYASMVPAWTIIRRHPMS